MLSTKGKRKVVFREKNYYWYIKKNDEGSPRIYISSEDKKLYLEYGFDRELAIDNVYIKGLLTHHIAVYEPKEDSRRKGSRIIVGTNDGARVIEAKC